MAQIINVNEVVPGKTYNFRFFFPGGFRMARVPETGRVIEHIGDAIKIQRANGSMETLYKEKIQKVYSVPNGGKRKVRKTRKGRKGTRKGVRKVHRKSRRSTCK